MKKKCLEKKFGKLYYSKKSKKNKKDFQGKLKQKQQAPARQDYSNPAQQVQPPNQSNRTNNPQQGKKSQGQAPPGRIDPFTKV